MKKDSMWVWMKWCESLPVSLIIYLGVVLIQLRSIWS